MVSFCLSLQCNRNGTCRPNCLRYYAGLATKPHGQTYEVQNDMQALVVREPVGVCALIVPWNYPLLIKRGQTEGARLVCGGHRITEGDFAKGFFVEPTIFTDTKPDMSIVREEIFGPVLAVQKFKDKAEAIYLANDSIYGLAGGVFTNDGAKAQRVIRKLRAGIIWINSYHPTYNEAPWGGYKQSGIGRDLGTFGYDEYTEVKQINISTNVVPVGWFSS